MSNFTDSARAILAGSIPEFGAWPKDIAALEALTQAHEAAQVEVVRAALESVVADGHALWRRELTGGDDSADLTATQAESRILHERIDSLSIEAAPDRGAE